MKGMKLVPVAAIALVLLIQVMGGTLLASTPPSFSSDLANNTSKSSTVDLGNGQSIELAPGESLHKFILTDQGWVEWSGDSSELMASEYGNTTLNSPGVTMKYLPSNVTTGAQASVSTGTDWEAYQVRSDLTNVYENRTWTQNPDLTGSSTGWTLGTTSGGSYSTEVSQYNASGHGTSDGCFDFFLNSNSGSAPYYYSSGDRAWAQQTMTVPRGQVVWAGLRTDYWAETRDNTHYGMTGAFSIYATVEGINVWELSFTAIGAERTWYDSGMIYIPPSVFNLPTDQNVLMQIGLWCKGTYGYAPNILPAAKFDNIELYLKTRATPTSLNLNMDDIPITNNAGYGSGYIIQTPTIPWTSNPVNLNFTWAPTPINPTPNRTIIVSFDLEVNMFARSLDSGTVRDINPTAYGEKFTIGNGSDAYYTTFFYADIPPGYTNRYFFNVTIPDNRDVYFLARPLAPGTNLTSGWSGGLTGDGYVNVSAYSVATEAGRYGYWRMLSKSPNMISDIELYDPNSLAWSRSVDLRAGNTTQVRAYLGPEYVNSIVNFTLYSPSGDEWYNVNVTTDATGYATTPNLTFSGANASAGNWMIQAITNDMGTNSVWRSTGFFKRSFNVTHTSALTINYPNDAVGTWTTNVTYGDLLLLVLTANDTDSNVLVPGGTLALSWALGSDLFDDSGNGQYTKVLDTSLLSHKGIYTIDLSWSANNFDTAYASLKVNVNYAANLTSPDYPGIEGPIGSSQSFTVNLKNVNGTGILGGNIACNWTGSYSVQELGSGTYQIDLDTTGVAIGEYPVEVTGGASFVEPQTMVMFVEVREIYNTISYSANQLSIPVGASQSFSFTWYDTDNAQPVSGKASQITCNWTSFHTLGEMNYTVVETSPGVYNITLFTEGDDPLTAGSNLYDVVFNVSMNNYQNHTFSIGVEVRRHNTLLVLDAPVEQTPIGQDVVVLLFYQDTDLMQGITNVTGYVDLEITSPEVPGLTFSSIASSLGDGHYNISIPSSQWSTIGWKNLTINAGWIGGDTYYSKSINTRVRLLGTETDVSLETAPTATNYLDNFTFTIVYYDTVNATRISNSSSNVFVSIVPLTGGHTVTQSDFVILELGTNPGTYSFNLNASLLGSARSFKFQITFSWSSGVRPLYENHTLTVTLVVLGIPTYIDYFPVQSTPYGETAEFSFSYVNSLTTSKIANSSSLFVGLLQQGITYSVSYDASTRVFTLLIDTTGFTIGTTPLTLNVTWIGDPYYQQVLHVFSVNVILRSTQLSHLSFANPQWSDIVSIEFVYTDLVSGSSADMVGTLSLDAALTGYYTVSSLGNGHYLVLLDTSYFSSTGAFVINATMVYTGTDYAADASEAFTLNVIQRITQMGYESPDATEYMNNVTFSVTYIEESTANPIPGATIVVSCSNSSVALTVGVNYWVTDQGTGQYMIRVSSVALGNIGVFVLHVTASKSGAPFYASTASDVNSQVVQRTTQILITQTPGEVSYLELVILKFKYSDFLTGTSITIDKSNIVLTHGPSMTLIADVDYTLTKVGSVYTISFNSSLLGGSLVTNYPIQLAIDASSGSPYYAPRSVVTKVTTVERPTQILFPLVGDTPFYDNITINFQYIDFITGTGISGASVLTEFSNISTPTVYIFDLGNGLYQVVLPSAQFGNTGTILFNVTLSKAGAPYYGARSAIDTPAQIIPVPTSLIAEVPPVGGQPVGQLFLVNVTFTNSVSDSPVTGATISTDWTSLYSTAADITEIGSGVYRITINTTGLLSQEYTFSIQAQLSFYRTANITASITPGAASAKIVLSQTSIYTEWGNTIQVRLNVQDPVYGTYIPGMNTTILWNGILYQFTDLLNGTYVRNLDTTVNDFGIYQPQITIERQYYQPQQTSMTIIVSKAAGEMVPEQSLFNVVTGSSQQLWVYLNDTNRNLPIEGATVSMEWNNTIYSLVTNSTPGFYIGTIDGAGFAIGQYEVKLTAVQTNFVILERTVTVYIVPVPTDISLVGGATGFVVYYGNTLNIRVLYNDLYHGGSVAAANLTYSLGGISGPLTQLPNGTYTASIDTSSFAAQVMYMKITASSELFQTIIKNYVVNIQPIPTLLSVDVGSKQGYYLETVTYTFSLNNALNGLPISGANIDVSWDGGSGTITDNHDGTYSVLLYLNVTKPKTYDVDIQVTKLNYATNATKVFLELDPFHIIVQGFKEISVPVNDTVTYYYNLNNTAYNTLVSDAFGIANWVGLEQDNLDVAANGSFVLVIPGDISIGTYTVDLSFSNPLYQVSPFSVDVTVRPVLTSLIVSQTTISLAPGDRFNITITYTDLDHNVGIPNAVIQVETSSGSVIYYEQATTAVGGTYQLNFLVQNGGVFNVSIQFSRGEYASAAITLNIESDLTAEQVLIQNITYGGGFLLLLVAAGLFYYVRYYSVPRQIRAMNKMIKALAAGKIPKPAEAPTRLLILLGIVNEELHPTPIRKTESDVAGESIEAHIPEINELLDRLAEITGLGAVELNAFRADLAKMRASERPGFIREVIAQEEARRAESLSKPEETEVSVEGPVTLSDRPEDIEEIRRKLVTKGMAPEEIDVILDEAKNLSKADLKVLLDSLGIRLD